MIDFIKRHIVQLLCLLGLAAPFVSTKLIDLFYFSSLFGWILGFICFISAYIIVLRRPDSPHESSPE